jgi:hypothetical protein
MEKNLRNSPKDSLAEEAPNLDVNHVRLVFLDVDGVLNSMKTCLLTGSYPYLKVDYTLYDNGMFNSPSEKVLIEPFIENPDGIDKYSIGLLNKLLIATNSHIVLSSTWRLNLDVYQCRDFLGAMGIDPLRVIGKTHSGNDIRGEEVFNWLQGAGEKRSANGHDFYVTHGRLIKSLAGVELNVRSYVILDDSSDFTEEQKLSHFVQTDDNDGLGLTDTLLAGAILTGKDFDCTQLMYGENHGGKILLSA